MEKKKKKETKSRHSLARRRKVNHLPSVRTNKSLGYKVRTIDSGFRSRILYRHEQKLFEFFMVWATRNWRLLDRVIWINSVLLDPSFIRTRAFGTNYDSFLSFFPLDCFQIRERSRIWFENRSTAMQHCVQLTTSIIDHRKRYSLFQSDRWKVCAREFRLQT